MRPQCFFIFHKRFTAFIVFINAQSVIKHSERYQVFEGMSISCIIIGPLEWCQIVFRALIVAGAEGAAAPFNFEQWVHAPVNFQPFYS